MIHFARLEKFRPGQDDPVEAIEWELTKMEYEDAVILLMGRTGRPGVRCE